MDNDDKKINKRKDNEDYAENREVSKIKMKTHEVKTNKDLFDKMMLSNKRNKKYFGWYICIKLLIVHD